MLSISFSIVFWLASFASPALLPSPQNAAQPSSAQSELEESDAIYKVIVDWRVVHPGEGPQAGQLVLLDTTVPYSCLGSEGKDCSADVKKQLSNIFKKQASEETIEDFLSRNSSTGPVSRTIPTELPQSFLSPAAEQMLFKSKHKDGWKTFYESYPKAGGIMAFSRVGFNKSRDQAILYSQISCGWLCGTGHYHLLKKDSGKWTMVGNFMAWIS